MKDFQEHIDEHSHLPEESRWEESQLEKTSFQKVWKALSRYSLLMVVGLAALSITFLRFQGQSVWESLRGTPLPHFSLEDSIIPKALPNKTEVYDQVLAEEARKQRQQGQITRPNWLGHVTTDTVGKKADTLRVAPDTLTLTPRPRVRPRKRTIAKPTPQPVAEAPASAVADDTVVTVTADFFQPVRVSASPTSGSFIRCVVDGDQQVTSNERIRLRLEESMSLNGQTIPAHTLLYGEVRLSQNRLHITIPRIGPQPVSLTVHDHTYHAGILLEERLHGAQEATEQTTFRQGQRIHAGRSLGLLPQVASELGRTLLQQGRRQSMAVRQNSVFLPDGFPLFLHHKNSPNP